MGEPDPLSRFLAWLLRALRSDMEAGWRSDGDLISLGNAPRAPSRPLKPDPGQPIAMLHNNPNHPGIPQDP